MSADRDALLAAIRADPDDDTPRLVFADWLEEHGEADFAQLIRLEIERDRLPQGHPRRQALDQEAFALRKAFPGYVHDPRILSPTRRGFHDYLMASVFALRAGLDRLGPYAPRLCVLLGADRAEEKAAEEEAERGGPDRVGAALREIFASPWVRHWDALECQSLRLTAERVRALLAPGNLTSLEGLGFAGGADDDAVRVLAQADLPRLTTLAVQEVRLRDDPLLTPAALVALAGSPLLGRLQHLDLFGDWVEDDGLGALAGSPRAAGLKSLYLAPRPESAAGVRVLLASPHLAGLTHLELPLFPLDPETVALLARPDVLPCLSTLVVPDEETADLTALRRRFGDGLVGGSAEDRSDGAE
jgi:uncharacterized protein (TIGR02996 family)